MYLTCLHISTSPRPGTRLRDIPKALRCGKRHRSLRESLECGCREQRRMVWWPVTWRHRIAALADAGSVPAEPT